METGVAMSIRSLDACYRIVAEAINSCSLPRARFEIPTSGVVGDDFHATFSDLGFDSLAFMEFCIAIQLETGVEISVAAVADLKTPAAVARRLSEIA